MLSKEKLLEAVDFHVAELLADQVYVKLKESLATERDMMLQELAHTRKTCEKLDAALTQQTQHADRLEKLLVQKEMLLQQNFEVQRQASKVLVEALKSLGANADLGEQ